MGKSIEYIFFKKKSEANSICLKLNSPIKEYDDFKDGYVLYKDLLEPVWRKDELKEMAQQSDILPELTELGNLLYNSQPPILVERWRGNNFNLVQQEFQTVLNDKSKWCPKCWLFISNSTKVENPRDFFRYKEHFEYEEDEDMYGKKCPTKSDNNIILDTFTSYHSYSNKIWYSDLHFTNMYYHISDLMKYLSISHIPLSIADHEAYQESVTLYNMYMKWINDPKVYVYYNCDSYSTRIEHISKI